MSYPLTLPTRYIDGYNNGLKFVCVVKLTLSGIQPIYFCTQPNVASTLTLKYLGNTLTTGTDLFYEDKLAAAVINGAGETEYDGIGEIDYSVDLQSGGGLASRNLASLTFLNQGTFHDFLSQFDIENGECEIWESYLPTSGAFEITSDMLLRFKGVLSGAPTYTYETLKVEAIDSRHLDAVYIPKVKVVPGNFPNRPEETDGRAIPILAGDFSTRLNQALEVYDLAPTVMADNIFPKFYVAGHAIGTSGDIYYVSDDGLWGKFQVVQSHASKSGYFPQVLTDDNGRSYVEFGVGAPYADFVIRPRIASDRTNVGWGVFPEDHSYAVDKDTSTYVTLAPTVGTGSQVILQFDQFTAPGKLIAAITDRGGDDTRALLIDQVGPYWCDYYIVLVYSNLTGTVNISYRRISGAQSVGFTTVGILSSGDTRSGTKLVNVMQSVVGLPLTWDILKDTEWRIDCATDAPTAGIQVNEIYLVCRSHVDSVKTLIASSVPGGRDIGTTRGGGGGGALRNPRVYAPQKVSRIMLQTYGAKYGPWISGRSAYTTSNAIENPAYFVEYLLREQMGVSGARIDTASFDHVALARASWKIAASIKDQKRAEEHIRQICFEFGMTLYLFPDSTTGEDQYTLKELPTAGDSSSYTVTTGDVIVDQESHVPQITISYTDGSKIFNDFYVKYFVDYSTGETTKSIYCSDTNGDGSLSSNLAVESDSIRWTSYPLWLSESQSRYRTRNPFETSLEFVRDSATAELFLKSCADWWAFKRQIVTVQVKKSLDTVKRQIGDIVKFDVDLVGSDRKNIILYVITKVNFPPYGKTSAPYITWECEEVPNEVTGLPIYKKLASKYTVIE